MGMRVGVDIGGTFIDFCLWDEAKEELHSLKVLTTPQTPGAELLRGLDLLQERHGVSPSDITSFVHGTTVGINTVIQRKGASLALLTTENFEDVVELARLRMPEAYSLFSRRGAPLVPRDRIFGIRERMLSDGTVEQAVDEASVVTAVEKALAKGVDGIVISLLNAYRNPAHEAEVAAIATRIAPHLFVFRSSEVWPIIREYERTTTALINGYVHPKVSDYLEKLIEGLESRGVTGRAADHQVQRRHHAGRARQARLRQHGPVGHGVGRDGRGLGRPGSGPSQRDHPRHRRHQRRRRPDHRRPAAVRPGREDRRPAALHPERRRLVDRRRRRIDRLGRRLRRAQGRPGERRLRAGTGLLRPRRHACPPSPMPSPSAASSASTTSPMARSGPMSRWRGPPSARWRSRINLGLEQTAEAIIRIAISGMFVEVNKLVARYGVDTRDFALLPFGGAGPMLGCFLARELGMQRVLIPSRPGVVSALGGLVANVKNDFIRTLFIMAADADAARLRGAAKTLQADGTAWLRDEQEFTGEAAYAWFADMRYRGQSFEIEVPLAGSLIEAGDMAAIAEAFHRAHEGIYDFCDRESAGADHEPAAGRLRRVAQTLPTSPGARRQRGARGGADAKGLLRRRLARCSLLPPAALEAHHRFSGPCVIVQDDTTACVPPGFGATVDVSGNIVLERAE